MALMDAKEYDPRPARRIRWAIAAAVVLGLAWLILWFWPIIPWFYRYGSEERAIDRFFAAIEHKDYDAAYGIYFADPDWKQHTEKYKEYSLPQFMRDWGPASEYKVITSHTIDCAIAPHRGDFQSPSGVIVVVTVNGSLQRQLWVEAKDKTITVAPDFWKVQCRSLG